MQVAAQNCRKRKIEVIQTLEEEVAELARQRDSLVAEQVAMTTEHREVQGKYQDLYREVMGTLRDADGRPYGTDYTLQHMPDGSVVLAPRGTLCTGEEEEEQGEEERGRDKRRRKKNRH